MRTVMTISHPRLRRWTVEIMPDRSGRLYPIVCDNSKLICDNPIKLRDGRILYDYPERVPAYAKALVVKAFRFIEQTK